MPVINQFNLSESPFINIIQSMHVSNFTGWLEVIKQKIKKCIFFENGYPMYATSNEEKDKMGEILVAHNKITRENLEKSLLLRQPGVKLGAILVRQNYITPSDLIWVVRKQAEQIIVSVFNWDDGLVNVIVDPFPDDVINLNINYENIVLEGARFITNPRIILNSIGRMEDLLSIAQNSKFIAKKVKLNEKELHLLDYIKNKSLSAREICQLKLYPAIETCKILLALLAVGIINKE